MSQCLPNPGEQQLLIVCSWLLSFDNHPQLVDPLVARFEPKQLLMDKVSRARGQRFTSGDGDVVETDINGCIHLNRLILRKRAMILDNVLGSEICGIAAAHK